MGALEMARPGHRSNHQLARDLDDDNLVATIERAAELRAGDKFCRFCGAEEDLDTNLSSTGYTHLRRLVQDPPASTRAQAWSVPQFGHRFMMCGRCQIGYERHRWAVRDVQRFEGTN